MRALASWPWPFDFFLNDIQEGVSSFDSPHLQLSRFVFEQKARCNNAQKTMEVDPTPVAVAASVVAGALPQTCAICMPYLLNI